MDQLQILFKHILDNGVVKKDRTGVGTIATFGYQCRFDLNEGFPIVTTKKTAFKAAVTELIWMIGGWMKDPVYEGIQHTNIKFLLDNNCHIWTEWPYKAYCQTMNICIKDDYTLEVYKNCVFINEDKTWRVYTQQEFEEKISNDKKDNYLFARSFGDLGPVYQKQWRDFEGKKEHVDQLMTMIGRLKSNPDDRRNLTSFWNPTELNEMMVSGLPPCHLLHQVWTRELTEDERMKIYNECMKGINYMLAKYNKEETWNEVLDRETNIPKRAISLQMYQRSSDCFLGVPFDWVFYSLLTHMLAEQTNMVVDEFIWVSGDTHLYLNSIDEAKEVLTREPYSYPKLNIKRKVDNIEDYKIEDFELIDYKYHPSIKVKVAV